jgi:choline-sulfatase
MSVGMREGFEADAISESEMMRARAAYMACVSYLDEVIGDLLLRLECDGLLDNTIIVYTTDHGEMAGEHGVWWKNGWYEACTHVPLIFSRSEQRCGRVPSGTCEPPVALIDIFPTLCALAGTEIPHGMDGIDLSPALLGSSTVPERPVFCDALNPRWGKGTEFRMIRWHQFKYVRFRDAPPLFFDLDSDPGEQINLIERGVSGVALGALREMQRLAEASMDFDEAERERMQDGTLAETYAQHLPPSTGNLYLMPSGRLINADDTIYAPTVIAERPEEAFEKRANDRDR